MLPQKPLLVMDCIYGKFSKYLIQTKSRCFANVLFYHIKVRTENEFAAKVHQVRKGPKSLLPDIRIVGLYVHTHIYNII